MISSDSTNITSATFRSPNNKLLKEFIQAYIEIIQNQALAIAEVRDKHYDTITYIEIAKQIETIKYN